MDLKDIDLEDLQRVLHRKAYKILTKSSVIGDATTDAEDLVQDTLVELLETTEDGNPFKLGVTIIERKTLNTVVGETRRREIERDNAGKIRRMYGEASEALAADPMLIIAAEEVAARAKTLSPLLAGTLEVICDDKGMTMSEAAEALNTTESTLYKRIQRIKGLIVEDDDDNVTPIPLRAPRMTQEAMEQGVKDNFDKRDRAVRLKQERIKQAAACREQGVEWTLTRGNNNDY